MGTCHVVKVNVAYEIRMCPTGRYKAIFYEKQMDKNGAS